MRRQQPRRREREWHVRRTGVPMETGQQRWDQAYQLLLRWAMMTPERQATSPAARLPLEVPDDHDDRSDYSDSDPIGRRPPRPPRPWPAQPQPRMAGQAELVICDKPIERLVNRLKQFRRVATRFEKRAAHFLAMLTLASLLLWL